MVGIFGKESEYGSGQLENQNWVVGRFADLRCGRLWPQEVRFAAGSIAAQSVPPAIPNWPRL